MVQIEKKYFPIKTATACQLKWAWSTINLQLGKTASCHRVSSHSFDTNTFNFHNTPQKLAQRKTMLEGQWPTNDPSNIVTPGTTTCESYCGAIEKTGLGQSDRQFFLTIPNLTPKELYHDATAINVTPTILEVYIDNTCNLSCVYCVPELSSRIDFEMKKHGPFNKNGLVLHSEYHRQSNYDQIEQNFWKYFQSNIESIERLHLLGGEPFYQRQFDTFLEFFENNPCPNLEFNIVTNLMLSKSKLENYVERLKELLVKRKLKRLDITASIDCWGPQQEFVRYGLDLKQWQENFEYLIAQRWIKLNINNAISVLTIKTLPDLLELLNVWNKDRRIEHYFSIVFDPTYMAPDIFGPEEFQDDFTKILALMETDSWRGTHAKTYLEGIVATIQNSVYNKSETLKLLTFLDEMDNRRKTNWRELFPWLIKYEGLCGIQE